MAIKITSRATYPGGNILSGPISPSLSMATTTALAPNPTLAGTVRASLTMASSSSFVSSPGISTGNLRFPGDPTAGHVYMGSNVIGGGNPAFTTLLNTLARPLGIVRLYDNKNGTVDDARVNFHKAGGRVTCWTITPSGSGAPYSDFAGAGTAVTRAWVDGLAAQFKSYAPWPIWVVWLHEPEDNITDATSQGQYRTAKRWIHDRLLNFNNVTNYAHVEGMYMIQTFDEATSGTGRDWRVWASDYKGTNVGTKANPSPADFYTGPFVDTTHGSCIDMMGFDTYNHWGQSGNANWVSFSSRFLVGWQYTNQIWPNIAYAIGETATGAYDGDPTYVTPDWSAANKQKTQAWFDDMYATALSKNIAGLMWFNDGSNHGLNNLDPNAWRYGMLRGLCDKPTTVLWTG